MTNGGCYVSFRDSLKVWSLDSPARVLRFHVDTGANPEELVSRELQLKCN